MPPAAQKTARDEPRVRREQILDETIRIIGERGYHGFTVQELAKRCGLSNAGLLYYFASKDLLLVAVLEEIKRREVETVAPVIERATQKGQKNPAAVLELLRAVVEVGCADPELLRLVNVLRAEALEAEHPAHAAIRKRDIAAYELFTKALTPFYTNPAVKALHVSAMLEGLGIHWIRSGQAFDIKREWGRVAESLLPELFASAKAKPRAAKAAKK